MTLGSSCSIESVWISRFVLIFLLLATAMPFGFRTHSIYEKIGLRFQRLHHLSKRQFFYGSTQNYPALSCVDLCVGQRLTYVTPRGMTSLAMTRRWQIGDSVLCRVEDNLTPGVVNEDRGRGWFAILLAGSNATVKVRGTQLVAAAANTTTETNTPTDATMSNITDAASSPFITIHDLDASLAAVNDDMETPMDEFLQQVAYHASFEKWVVFSDLHCAPSTLDTCLKVLTKVHEVAVSYSAGVLFLGDFWHQRGTLRVECLNAVLENLRGWTVPLVMIPGNHDQVTLGGKSHALTPIENAFMLRTTVSNGPMIPGPLVLSYPTKFRNALFVPHIRDITTMESILQSPLTQAVSSLFVHADVNGAFMNDLIVSQDGIPPSSFPPNKRIYSGHFHKPHTVQSGNVKIEYLGSPYETSLAEAQQGKSLAILDSSWRCIEYIPLDIGRKHFKVSTWYDILRLRLKNEESACGGRKGLKQGDRVVVTVCADDVQSIQPAVAAHINELRQGGIIVEIREVRLLPSDPMKTTGGTRNLEEMTTDSTWRGYLADAVHRDAMSDKKANSLLTAGFDLLEEIQSQHVFEDQTQTAVDLQFTSISVEGFGPFKDPVAYPLANRGLVLLRGTNNDSGSDSNGSGKSSLAMAPLWAITGALDPRRVQDSRTTDVVNDDSKTAKATLHGTVDSIPFIITRTKSQSKGSLVFQMGDSDLTTQSVKETQAVINEKLGITPSILSRTVFHGQHSINELLESTDSKLKEELSLVVPLAVWQEAATLARARSREAGCRAAELNGMIALRTADVEKLTMRRDAAREESDIKQKSLDVLETQFENEITKQAWPTTSQTEFTYLELRVHEASDKLNESESNYKELLNQRDDVLGPLERDYKELSSSVASLTQRCQNIERELFAASLRVDSLKVNIAALERKWDIDLSAGRPNDFEAPNICPTCHQSISNDGLGHSRAEIQSVAEEDIDQAILLYNEAKNSLDVATAELDAATEAVRTKENAMKEMKEDLDRATADWNAKLLKKELDVSSQRMEVARLSAEFSEGAKRAQQIANAKTLEATISSERAAASFSNATLNALEEELREAESLLASLTSQAEAENLKTRTMSELGEALGQRGVQTFVLQNVVDALQILTRKYLEELSDGSQRLDLTLDAGDRIARTTYVRTGDGEYKMRPLSTLSGGQWRRCSLALTLAFAELVSRRGKLRPSLCVLDEPLTHLDRTGRTRVGHLVRKMLHPNGDPDGLGVGLGGLGVSTVVMILQDLAAEELEESFDCIDEVEKRGGSSTVRIDLP